MSTFGIVLGVAAILMTSCGGVRHLTGKDIQCLEARDENEPSVFQIVFDPVALVAKDSLLLRGGIQTAGGQPLAGASVQFGLWKTVEEGAYFIIRREFTADLDGRFEIATRVQDHEWMVVETVLGNRFFRISQIFAGCGN